MSSRDGYSPLQILLHWLIAALVLFNYLYSEGMGRAMHAWLDHQPMPATLDISPWVHVWVGSSVLVLVLLRLVIRLARPAPPPPGSEGLRKLARLGHGLLYLILIAVPLLGAVAWFGRLDSLTDLHALAANGLMILAGAHAVVALFHHFVLQDGLLGRMIPGLR